MTTTDSDARIDRAWIAGARFGWNCSDAGNSARFNAAIRGKLEDIVSAKHAAVSSSERRCGDESGSRLCIHCGRSGDDNPDYCGKQRGLQKCEFPAIGAAYVEGFNDAAAVARTLNSVATTGAGEGQQRDIWDLLNKRRHELIDVKRNRELDADESADFVALQRVAGLVREMLTPPLPVPVAKGEPQ